MIKKSVLVLGSKPGSFLPDINVGKIYTANGAAERAEIYRKKFKNNELICICGASEFARNEHVSSRIIKSKPQKLIIRSGKIELPDEIKNDTKLVCMGAKNQWNFQKHFFYYNGISLFLSEFLHQEKFLDKFKHVIKSIRNNNLWGVSTGFFAILLALSENLDSNIIVSGIGMRGGKQFYKSERSKYFIYDSRARIDRFMIKKLKKTFKKRLFSLDNELVELASISKWDRKSF